jgi:hypothetical protein
MAVTYTWTFPKLEVVYDDNGFKNVVRLVHWRLKAEESGVSSDAYGTVGLPSARMPFTAYEALTPSVVQKWTERALGDELNPIKDGLAASLIIKAAPSSGELSPPWE